MTKPRTEAGEALRDVVPNVAEGLPPKEKISEEKLPEEKLHEERTPVRKPDLSTIEVYAFVGPAGTGKSQRASQVARQHGIDLIVDDGLVVSRGRIMAAAFRTDMRPQREIDDELFSSPSRVSTAEGAEVQFTELPGTNLAFDCKKQIRTYRLNKNNGKGFDFKLGRTWHHWEGTSLNMKNQYIANPYFKEESYFKETKGKDSLSNIWLASPKTTDALFLRPQKLPNLTRSEERRVGKECRSRWSPYN